jgi:glycogen operon protein
MTAEEWDDPAVRCVAAIMESRRSDEDAVLLLFNSSGEETTFTLPADETGRTWRLRIDTRDEKLSAPEEAPRVQAGEPYTLLSHSMAVFTSPARAHATASA